MAVIDVDSGTLVGKIENTAGVHGLAIAPELGRGFVSNGRTATVTIFDPKTVKKIGDVPTGKKPDAIIYDQATGRVFAFKGGSKSATVIDAKEGKVEGTVDLGAVRSSRLRTARDSSSITWQESPDKYCGGGDGDDTAAREG